MQLTFRGWDRHEPYAYAVWQRDRNSEARFRPFQRFTYDSFYAGIGSTGELIDHLRYLAEFVYESGRSFGHKQFLFDNTIRAFAARTRLEYLFPGRHRTRASLEYVFGSGDGERFASPTNAVGGNLGDRTDSGFVGFGYVNTGLALTPTVSNLHMGRASASFYPWPDDARLRNLELGTEWYLFYKHHRDGAISDPTATVRSGYVGWEMDYYLNWRMTADLAWTARAGVFFPGRAYRDRTSRTFLLLGLTWSF
ncbi:MAG: hypothetical protein D6788_04225 [Planctomycetota bacterium]|nr:MAG: hypothetical protein D6788_04225 [Planctomycetota bacterium]